MSVHAKKVNHKIYESSQITGILKYNPALIGDDSSRGNTRRNSNSNSNNNGLEFKIVKVESHKSTYYLII